MLARLRNKTIMFLLKERDIKSNRFVNACVRNGGKAKNDGCVCRREVCGSILGPCCITGRRKEGKTEELRTINGNLREKEIEYEVPLQEGGVWINLGPLQCHSADF